MMEHTQTFRHRPVGQDPCFPVSLKCSFSSAIGTTPEGGSAVAIVIPISPPLDAGRGDMGGLTNTAWVSLAGRLYETHYHLSLSLD
jgi:hypothetical protein